jgi:hypothetical protein
LECGAGLAALPQLLVKRLAAGYAQLFLERFPDAMGREVELGAAFLNGKAIMEPARSAISIKKMPQKENAPTKKMLRRKSCVESSSAGDIDCENGCCSAKRQDAIECGVL